MKVITQHKVWEEVYEAKLHSDRLWDRVYTEKNIEMISYAIDLCNKAEQKLLNIEAQMRLERMYAKSDNDSYPQNTETVEEI